MITTIFGGGGAARDMEGRTIAGNSINAAKSLDIIVRFMSRSFALVRAL
jgi:hypothetical protein